MTTASNQTASPMILIAGHDLAWWERTLTPSDQEAMLGIDPGMERCLCGGLVGVCDCREIERESCEHCGEEPIEQTRFEGFICAACYDEALASDEADRAYDAWRDAQIGA
jgi:hypothetical protein